VLGGSTGRDLIAVLQRTGMAELLYALGLFVGLLLALPAGCGASR
jgi:hypothetical protein